MADFKGTPIEKNAFNARKMTLQAPNSAGKNAGLIIRLHNNQIRIQVYTNDPNDTGRGAISANMEPYIFADMLEMISEAIASPAEYRNYIDNLGHKFFSGKKSEKPEVLSRTVVGRDEAGIIYISIVENGRPNVRFPLLPTAWHVLRDNNGDVSEKARTSQLHAKGFVRIWTQLLGAGMVAYFKSEEQANGNNNNNNTRNNGGGGGSGGYGRSANDSSISDEGDIPW